MGQDRKVRIALGQMKVVQGDTKENLRKMMEMIDQAAEQNVDIICFPELAYTGYFLSLIHILSGTIHICYESGTGFSQSGLEHAILYFDGGEGNYYGNYRHDRDCHRLYPVLYRTV